MKHYKHRQTFGVEPETSRTQGIIIAVACIACFAFVGVLLAYRG